MTSTPSRSILVVDDHESWRDLLVAILEGDNHKVMATSTFQEAQTLLKAECFDLVILDMQLVDTSVHNIQGKAFLDEAKRLYPLIKVVISNRRPSLDQNIEKLNFYGADSCFEKTYEGQSFDIGNFSELINGLLRE